MAKNNKVVKRDGRIFKEKVPAKLRIGTRKSGTSAHRMSNDALLAVLTGKNHAKDRDHAATVLRQRNVAF